MFQNNSFALFAKEQIAKEIAYHVVFCTTNTYRIRLVMADINAAAFRHAPHPPVDMLALLGSTVSAFDSPGARFAHFCHQCYQALMSKLVNIWGVNDIMPNLPTISQVHQELCKSIFLLLLQQNDTDTHTSELQCFKDCVQPTLKNRS